MKRNFFIHARVSELEYRALNLIARRENINPSETVRLILRDECNRRGLTIALAKLYENIPAEVQNGN